MAARGKYEASTAVDSLSKLVAQLQADLRKDVHDLAAETEVFSSGWVAMTERLARIAHVTDMERDLPKADGATIWDSDEAGLRFVLEEGKLSLIVRAAIAHAVWLSKAVGGAPSGVDTASADEIDGLAALELGTLGVLGNAWLHEEAIQTLEPALIVELLAASFTACSAAGKALDMAKSGTASEPVVSAGSGSTPDGEGAAESAEGEASAEASAEAAASASSSSSSSSSSAPRLPLPEKVLTASCRGAKGMGAQSLRLVLRLSSKLDRLPESRILAEILRFGLVRAFAEHIVVNGAALPSEQVAEGLMGMALLVSGEEIGAARAELLADPDARRLLVGAGEAGGVIAQATKDTALKRKLRPLLDLIRAAKRLG